MTLPALDPVLDMLPRSIDVHASPLRLDEPFIDMAGRFAHLPGAIVLASGGDSDCARYNIMGIHPWLTLRGSLNEMTLQYAQKHLKIDSDPFAVLQQIVRRYRFSAEDPSLPIAAGLLGYLSYDLKDGLENLPRTSIDDLNLPHLCMCAPTVLVVDDRVKKHTTLYIVSMDGDTTTAADRRFSFEAMLSAPHPGYTSAKIHTTGPTSGLTRDEYVTAVEAIRDYIMRGHVYQVNLSQRFEAHWEGDAFALFKSLFDKNPAPFFAYINAGDHQIVSTSPERFIWANGKNVETRPIKGTRPRGKTPEQDRLFREELSNSKKDEAELSMIVDLLRNDFGKVCRTGSVTVRSHKQLEEYDNVFHLVSIIDGVLDDDRDPVDLIRATFPGGSITGCPKIRSMEIIDELEPVRRHIYTGSIGYISFHDTMDLSIAIRTATIKGKRFLFSVGGGVVYDSDPDDEYEETLHKGRTLMSGFGPGQTTDDKLSAVGWCNGRFKPVNEMTVSVEDDGFQYGYGIFETIRVQYGIPYLMDAHIERFNKAWRFFFTGTPPDVTWDAIISQVIDRCSLTDGVAAVKILAAAGKHNSQDGGNTLLVTARPYKHRLKTLGRNGLHLAVHPHPRHSYLSGHKTMNYMFYWAVSDRTRLLGADEAIILNADGSVSETATANIFCKIEGKLYRPSSEYALPGTMEKAVCELLSKWGTPVESRILSIQDLKRADQVFLTNALMGAVPVLRIDESDLSEDRDALCTRLNGAVFGEVNTRLFQP